MKSILNVEHAAKFYSGSCRAVQQQFDRGLTGYESEFLVEVGSQDCKSAFKYRCSHSPDIVLVTSLLVRAALARVKGHFGYRDGQPYIRTLDVRVPQVQAGEKRLHVGDRGPTCTGSQLLGSGKAVDVATPRRSEVVKVLQQAIVESPQLWHSKFPLHTVDECSLTVPHLKGSEVLLSESYAATKSRLFPCCMGGMRGAGILHHYNTVLCQR